MQVDTGYSSIHLVAFCSVRQEDKPTKVPIEIQIRTVFEDAWGEIDHKLRYSLNRNRSPASKNLLESWQPHLNVLKAFTDGCGQYAGIIKNQAIDTRSRPEMDPFVPVDNSEEALKQIGGCSAELRAIFEKAYSLRAQALKSANLGEHKSVITNDTFLVAAGLFSAAHELIPTTTFGSPRERDAAIFLSKMERAFCLLSTGKKSSIDEAISIYSEAQDFSPNSVVVYYRYAQALIKLEEFDAAIAKYNKAESLLATDHHVPKSHWLHVLIPTNLGYATWRQSLLCADDENGKELRLELLVAAYRHTKRAGELAAKNGYSRTERSRARNANNALYYAVEYMALTGLSEGGPIAKSEVQGHLELLQGNVDLATASLNQLNWIDTLCRAHALFENTERAVLAAERIEHLLSAPPDPEPGGDIVADASFSDRNAMHSYYATTSHLNDRERDMLDHALWVLRKYGPGPERVDRN